MSQAVAAPDVETLEKTSTNELLDKGWNVIVWNDHINTMIHVTYVFQRVLGFDAVKAREKMLEVHFLGKSCVATAPREKAEFYWQRLQQFGLKTTIERVV